MSTPQDLEKQMAEKTEQELQAMFAKPDDWTPEALSGARAELQKRKITIVTQSTKQDSSSAMLHVKCPSCQETLAVREGLVGKSVKCPHCQSIMVVGAPGVKQTTPGAPVRQSPSDDFIFNTFDFSTRPLQKVIYILARISHIRFTRQCY
ncbi:MAG: hypothetical protein ACLQU4_20785 [Limisphaerales bacterium]